MSVQTEPEYTGNPLLRFSLAGEGNALEAEAQRQIPLLANLTLLGQTSVWYGPPNTGKTLLTLSLLLKAISDDRIDAAKVFYVNADDSASGMARKAAILDDVGAHTLAPGYKGFKLAGLAPALAEMAKDGSAKGSFIVIDTLKKVADLMSKKECAEFGQVARHFSLHGGTLLGLAHTNKKTAVRLVASSMQGQAISWKISTAPTCSKIGHRTVRRTNGTSDSMR